MASSPSNNLSQEVKKTRNVHISIVVDRNKIPPTINLSGLLRTLVQEWIEAGRPYNFEVRRKDV